MLKIRERVPPVGSLPASTDVVQSRKKGINKNASSSSRILRLLYLPVCVTLRDSTSRLFQVSACHKQGLGSWYIPVAYLPAFTSLRIVRDAPLNTPFSFLGLYRFMCSVFHILGVGYKLSIDYVIRRFRIGWRLCIKCRY